jgi:DNA polymerase II
LPSRMDSRVPVANRYFGVFQDGTAKVRGIEARRRDTPPWVVETQSAMLKQLSLAATLSVLPAHVSKAFEIFRKALVDFRADRVPIEKLVITSRISHELESYRSPTPAARAAIILLKQTGKRVRPGQKMRFIFTHGDPDVQPWENQVQFDVTQIDKEKYIELLARAASSVLYPFGVGNDELKQWAHSATIDLEFKFERQANNVRPVYDHVRPRRVEGVIGARGAAR